MTTSPDFVSVELLRSLLDEARAMVDELKAQLSRQNLELISAFGETQSCNEGWQEACEPLGVIRTPNELRQILDAIRGTAEAQMVIAKRLGAIHDS
jgi:hypothetical protein